jgi:hypothetical protein
MKLEIATLLENGISGSFVLDDALHILVIPDQVIARITTEPKLPPIPIQLQLNPGFSLNGEIQYSSFIEYTEHNRNDRTQTITGRSASLSFTVNFGDVVQGGHFSIDLTIPWKHTSGQTGIGRLTGQSSVRGINPTKADSKARLGGIEVQVTGYRESRFRQFDSSELPLFGLPNGFGIMQLDTPPATARQVWDWKANVDAGKALFATKANDARTYPARVRQQYPDATDFTAEQLKMETYQRFNGGAYWKWDDANKKWVKSPPNNYADESLAIETAVLGGNPPGDWN